MNLISNFFDPNIKTPIEVVHVGLVYILKAFLNHYFQSSAVIFFPFSLYLVPLQYEFVTRNIDHCE